MGLGLLGHFRRGPGEWPWAEQALKLKNKGPVGLSPRDKSQAHKSKRLTLSLLHSQVYLVATRQEARLSVLTLSVPVLSCRKFSFTSFPSQKQSLFLIDTHHGCWYKNFDDFWKLPVIMRQNLPFVIKATHPFCSGSWHFFFRRLPCARAVSFNKKLCSRALWKRYSFLGYCCPRIWKGPGNKDTWNENLPVSVEILMWGRMMMRVKTRTTSRLESKKWNSFSSWRASSWI